MRKWIEREFQITYSERGNRGIFYRQNLSFTRPTYTLEKADPEKQASYQQEFEEVKKLLYGEIDLILFEDESMIRDDQAIICTWFPKGQQKIIHT